MYYAAKGLELLGMSIIAIGFIIKFPSLMDPKMLLAGIICFATGWVTEKYILTQQRLVQHFVFKKVFFFSQIQTRTK